jgi:hypothetical protein
VGPRIAYLALMDLFTPSTDGEWKLLLALIAVAGGLVGSLVGFLSNQVSTSRTIARQERDKRRDAYGDYLGAVVEVERTIKAGAKLVSAFNQMKGHIGKSTESPTSAELQRLKTIANELDRCQRDLADGFNQLELMLHQLSLYADGSILDAAGRVLRALSLHSRAVRRSAEDGVQVGEVTSAVSSAVADFTFLARADSRSAGSPTQRKTLDAVRRMWDLDDELDREASEMEEVDDDGAQTSRSGPDSAKSASVGAAE